MLYALREQVITTEFGYVIFGIDPALGAAKVFQGDFAGGIRFLEELLKRNEAARNRLGADVARMYHVETYIELLAPKQMPPFRILLKNIPFLIVTALTGRKKAI